MVLMRSGNERFALLRTKLWSWMTWQIEAMTVIYCWTKTYMQIQRLGIKNSSRRHALRYSDPVTACFVKSLWNNESNFVVETGKFEDCFSFLAVEVILLAPRRHLSEVLLHSL